MTTPTMHPFNPTVPTIPTPAEQAVHDPDEIDRLLVERLTAAIHRHQPGERIYVSLDGIARGPVPRTGLDPIRARAKAIAKASGWSVTVDGRSGGLWLTPPAAVAGVASSLEARSIAILKNA